MESVPKFFNYHEYRQFNRSDPSKPIIITHFPNVYPSDATDIDIPKEQTRIVRIPRLMSIDYPQFSPDFPGCEDAAIKGAENGGESVFKPEYQYEGQWFGTTSASPLGLYLQKDEYKAIVSKVNDLLKAQYASSFFWVVYIILDILTLGLLTCFRFGKHPALSLEEYIRTINKNFKEEGKLCRVISPRLSGYLSLDFEIPRPERPM
ncbi:hypothetical protein HII13_000197 [Brettanomyces bruxellensis]|uniref:Ras modification protein ERF4 n=1 Tax=Dekkera bruxellensis TaxID=5007 RepID=A0A3F2Y5T2_DEKBR|nr:hypothetical protein HII12_003979 [Brettanomyces bruxellensis]KAF6015261.1 hypothetical protein HII13_000197 [Brettanomyces bruxellensis]VUG18987.1 DEBR0S4_07646g1_1 [Brettanomyces bruxellensis]